jgi:hypothetical protein
MHLMLTLEKYSSIYSIDYNIFYRKIDRKSIKKDKINYIKNYRTIVNFEVSSLKLL